MPRGTHIPGPPLFGFWGLFEDDYGDSSTPEPLAVVTPSRVGGALLPFRCPRCRGVPQALACPRTRDHYLDRRPGRGNHWCPLCGARFRIDLRGAALPSALPAGADVAPSLVEDAGGQRWQDAPSLVGTALGVLFGRAGGTGHRYRALAARREG